MRRGEEGEETFTHFDDNLAFFSYTQSSILCILYFSQNDESMSYILNVYVLFMSLTRRRHFHFFLAVWDSPGEEELGLVPHREEEVGDVVVRVTVHALTDTQTQTGASQPHLGDQTGPVPTCVCKVVLKTFVI